MEIPYETQVRVVILRAYVAKRKISEIIEFFGFPKSTVYDQYRSLDAYVKLGNPVESYNLFRSSKNTQLEKPHSAEIVSKVKEVMDSDATTPKREIARKLGVSHTTVNRIVCWINKRSKMEPTSSVITKRGTRRSVERTTSTSESDSDKTRGSDDTAACLPEKPALSTTNDAKTESENVEADGHDDERQVGMPLENVEAEFDKLDDEESAILDNGGINIKTEVSEAVFIKCDNEEEGDIYNGKDDICQNEDDSGDALWDPSFPERNVKIEEEGFDPLTMDRAEPLLTCDICQASFSSVSNLHMHQIIHQGLGSGGKPLTKATVKRQLVEKNTLGDLAKHRKIIHTPTTDACYMKCDQCLRRFKTVLAFDIHLNVCKPTPKCHHCNEDLIDTSVEDHLKLCPCAPRPSSPPPPPSRLMSRLRNFTVNLAKAGLSQGEILTTVDAAYPGHCLSESQVHKIMEDVKAGKDCIERRGHLSIMRQRTPDFIAAVKLDIEADSSLSVTKLVEKYNVSRYTIYKVLTEDLGLIKKSNGWVSAIDVDLKGCEEPIPESQCDRCCSEDMNDISHDEGPKLCSCAPTSSSPPPSNRPMSGVRNFTANLAKAGLSDSEIFTTVQAAYPGKCLSESQVGRIIQAVKTRNDVADSGSLPVYRLRTPDFIAAVKLDIETDNSLTVTKLVKKYKVSRFTIHKVLIEDLGLVKKSRRWVPKLNEGEDADELVE